MADQSIFKLTIAFVDPELDAAEKDEEVQKLFRQTRDLDEFESVSRVRDSNIPEGSMGGGFLNGLLKLEFLAENAPKIFRFLGERLKKPIEFELVVSATGEKLIIKANNETELVAAIEAAIKFISATKSISN
jgi:hypothetical protein